MPPSLQMLSQLVAMGAQTWDSSHSMCMRSISRHTRRRKVGMSSGFVRCHSLSLPLGVGVGVRVRVRVGVRVGVLVGIRVRVRVGVLVGVWVPPARTWLETSGEPVHQSRHPLVFLPTVPKPSKLSVPKRPHLPTLRQCHLSKNKMRKPKFI